MVMRTKLMILFFLLIDGLTAFCQKEFDDVLPMSLSKRETYMVNFNNRFGITDYVRYKSFDVKTMTGVVADSDTLRNCLLVCKTDSDVYIKEEKNPQEVYYYTKLCDSIWYSFRCMKACEIDCRNDFANAADSKAREDLENYKQSALMNQIYAYDIFVCNGSIWELKTSYIPEKDVYKIPKGKAYKKKVYGQSVVCKRNNGCAKFKNDYEGTLIGSSMNVLDEMKSILKSGKPRGDYLLRFNGRNYEYVWVSGFKEWNPEIEKRNFWKKKDEPCVVGILPCETLDMVNILCDLK